MVPREMSNRARTIQPAGVSICGEVMREIGDVHGVSPLI